LPVRRASRSRPSATTSSGACWSSRRVRRPVTDSTGRTEEVARLQFIQRAKLLGLTLEEIRELVELAARCNEGEIVPHLEEMLSAKLEETERKIAELTAFRQNLLYYRERAEDLRDRVPTTDRYCEDVSFCGCLEAVTGEGGEHGGDY
jgi:hypothetical protein